LHLLCDPLVLLVDVVILLGQLGNRVLGLIAIEIQLHLVEGLPAPVELAEASNLLISGLQAPLQILDLLGQFLPATVGI
jgi:hypothetical protein